MGNFGSGSVLTFTKMRESKIKSPGLVAYPKILNPESKVKTIYFANPNTLNIVNSEILMNPEKSLLV